MNVNPETDVRSAEIGQWRAGICHRDGKSALEWLNSKGDGHGVVAGVFQYNFKVLQKVSDGYIRFRGKTSHSIGTSCFEFCDHCI